MTRKVLFLTSVFSFIFLGLISTQEVPVSDTDVLEGVRLVQEGEYDAAIVTLDRAARRLEQEPARAKELAHAYLYLGIAYLGKGHEAAAKAQFREAIGRITDLTLSPEDYSPRVIDLFEAAREEAASESEPLPEPPIAEDGGGSKLPLILAGVGGAAGVGIALGSGGGDDAPAFEPTVPPPSPTPTPQVRTQVFPGVLTEVQSYAEVTVGPGAAGRWEAQLSWTNPNSIVFLEVYTTNGEFILESRLLTGMSVIAEWEGDNDDYFNLSFYYDPEEMPEPGSYELRVSYPSF